MATAGSSPSMGAISGARTAYELHHPGLQENPNQNQNPNQTPRKYATPGGAVRQRSTSNLRAPVPSAASSRKSNGDTSRSVGGRNGDQGLDQADQFDDIPENMYRPDKEDLAGWIHREKLAKIENEELQAAGINLAKARSKNKDATSGRTRDTSRDRRDFGSGTRDEKRLRMSSPVNEDPDELSERDGWDLRTPEEIASDAAASQVYATPLLRKSGSKIPVMTSSPTPIPSDRYERDTPMPRKRTMSGSITPEDSLAAATSRNGQDGEMATPNGKTGSPTKQRSKSVGSKVAAAPADAKPPPGGRKLSISNKALLTQPNAANNRPPTRGNDSERPRTAGNPPEGDPPWLATMYKPDPRLPPDQQLIPTLAKKQQQQMWEANGDVPATYDRNFSPLQIYGADGHPQPASNAFDNNHSTEGEHPEAWPLKPIPQAKSMVGQQRPPTSSGTGGYSTMPKVADPPITVGGSPILRTGSPASMRAHTPQGSQPLSPPMTQGRTGVPSRMHQQVLTPEEEEKVQKKGCCCVVM